MAVTCCLWVGVLKSILISFLRYVSLRIGPWLVSLSRNQLLMFLLWHICVYRINTKGKSTHPCGQPIDNQTWLDRIAFIWTLWVLLVKKQTNKQKIPQDSSKMFLFGLNCSKSSLIKIWGWIVLKAKESQKSTWARESNRVTVRFNKGHCGIFYSFMWPVMLACKLHGVKYMFVFS